MPGLGDGGPAARAVALGPTPPDADLLYAQPADGLPAERLAGALATLGFDAAPGHDGARVRVPADADPAALAARLAASGLVRSVEADAVVRAASHGALEPDDPRYANGQREYLDVVRAPEAWAVQTGSRDVLIAVVDTGIDFNHPDLATQIAVNFADTFLDGRDDDGSGCPDDIAGCNFVSLSTADPSCGYVQGPPNWRAFDDEGHGSFVAGVAAAAGDNALGVAGVAWRARLLPVKVLDCTATGRISDAAAGIRYAADRGADVINVSFGTPNDSPALRDAVEYAQSRGAVVVASAGNDGRRGVTFPAAYPGVLAVAASGGAREGVVDYTAIAEFANFGPGVDVIAPGVALLSTVPAATCEGGRWSCRDGPYAAGTGSSFATPMVAGAVALLVAEHPGRSPEFIARLLLDARAPRAPGDDPRLLDLAGALHAPTFGLGVPGTSRTGPREEPPGPGG